MMFQSISVKLNLLDMDAFCKTQYKS